MTQLYEQSQTELNSERTTLLSQFPANSWTASHFRARISIYHSISSILYHCKTKNRNFKGRKLRQLLQKRCDALEKETTELSYAATLICPA